MHTHDEIQRLGAQAARGGMALWQCPYYVAAEMPAHTGEPIREWRERVQAWEAGWLKETQSWLPAAGGRPTHGSGDAHTNSPGNHGR